MGKVSDQKKKKHIPKRASNERRKSRRAASWLRGQARKAKRIEKQRQRELANRKLRSDGCATPWESAKLKRANKRKGNGRYNEEMR